MELVNLPPSAAADVNAICRERLVGLELGDPLVQRIVQEAQGSPFLAAQLAALAHAKLVRGTRDLECSIDELISQTKALLTPEASELLSVLAVAGRPIQTKLALRAAQVRRGARNFVLELQRMQLVRSRDVAGERLLGCNDRIREAVQQLLDPEGSQRIHARCSPPSASVDAPIQTGCTRCCRGERGRGCISIRARRGRARNRCARVLSVPPNLYKRCLEPR